MAITCHMKGHLNIINARDERMRLVAQCLGLASGLRNEFSIVEHYNKDVGAKIARD